VAVKLYCAEAIRSGITTAVDNADSAQYPGIPAASIETYQECGLRTVYARMFFDKTAPELNTLIQNFIDKEPGIKHVKNLETTAHALAEIEKLFKTYHKTSHDRIHIWPAPAMPCVITPEGMRGSRALAHQYGTNWTMHMAETGMEEKVHWMSPIEYTDTLGCLDSKLLLAHCVFSDQKDIRLLKRNDTKVATQAVSNAYLASGIAPIPAMIAAGVTVGLGTDDANCNDSVNFITDMKIFALLHRALHRDAAILSPEKILEVATIDGARALGMEKSIGSLEVGKKADVILIDLRHPQTTPNHNLPATLVFQACGNEVDTVIIDGEIVMQNRALKFLPPAEEAAFYADAQTRSGEILQRSGIPATRAWRSI
jgi:atrazine chlorohydrolase/5-methylthioadenosine/S-adenosylhomocysteine deaminase/melamine deaminase